MDDFEAFRQAKQKKAEDAKKAAARAKRPGAGGKPPNWVDGCGPAGATNPKVKGFILGRYRKKKIDPATLQRPDGYESTARTAPSASQRNADKAELELERRMAALKKAQADLEAAEIKRSEADVAARRREGGFGAVKGRQRY
ncbi:MAG: hypothetical protein JKY65_12235 [Planctomycetes bacterium]|nr:hypothetical protein [Planctomycetota bacterium]